VTNQQLKSRRRADSGGHFDQAVLVANLVSMFSRTMLSSNYPHPACYKASFRPGRITTDLAVIRPEGHFTIGRRIWKNSRTLAA